MLVDFSEVQGSVRNEWKREHTVLGIFTVWKPFQNERHFNRVIGDVLNEFDARSDLGNYDNLYDEEDDGEMRLMTEIIDVVMQKEFPNVNRNNILIRAAIHFVAVALIKKLHEDSEGLSPRTKVARWLGQYRAATA